jgi:hypothetical protein
MANRAKAAMQSIVAIVWMVLVFVQRPSFRTGHINYDRILIDLISTAFVGIFALVAIEFTFRALVPHTRAGGSRRGSDPKP